MLCKYIQYKFIKFIKHYFPSFVKNYLQLESGRVTWPSSLVSSTCVCHNNYYSILNYIALWWDLHKATSISPGWALATAITDLFFCRIWASRVNFFWGTDRRVDSSLFFIMAAHVPTRSISVKEQFYWCNLSTCLVPTYLCLVFGKGQITYSYFVLQIVPILLIFFKLEVSFLTWPVEPPQLNHGYSLFRYTFRYLYAPPAKIVL